MDIKGFSEIVLIVKDISKSKKFYEDVVGLNIEKADDEWVWFYVGDKNDQGESHIKKSH